MDVSIIIVNYNTKTLTRQCVDSVFEKTTGISFEVILVDNASTDGSREHFEGDNRITYIYSNENLGFGRANNLGFARAKGDYLFFLNSDTYLVNNAVFILWDKMKCILDSGVGAVISCGGTMLQDQDGHIIHSYARYPRMLRSMLDASLFPILWKLRVLKDLPNTSNYGYVDNQKECFDVEYITGADLMVRKDIAEKKGLFDPDFFMYFEETEMQNRYLKAGFRSVIFEGPRIVHLEGKSNKTYSPSRTTMVLRSQFLYFKKTHNVLSYTMYSIIFKILYTFTYIICFPFINGTAKDKINHVLAIICM